jgi:hypothetical protein
MRMSRKLAELVLPNRGFGGDGRFGKASRRSSAGSASRGSAVPSPDLEVLDLRYEASTIVMKWRLRWGMVQPDLPREITLCVDSEAGPITPAKWAESKLGAFPFQLQSPTISSASASVKIEEASERIVISLPNGTVEQLGLVLEGDLRVRMADSDGSKLLRPVIDVRISDKYGAAL